MLLREVDGDANKQPQPQQQKESQPTREEIDKLRDNPQVRVVETESGPKVLKHLRG